MGQTTAATIEHELKFSFLPSDFVSSRPPPLPRYQLSKSYPESTGKTKVGFVTYAGAEFVEYPEFTIRPFVNPATRHTQHGQVCFAARMNSVELMVWPVTKKKTLRIVIVAVSLKI